MTDTDWRATIAGHIETLISTAKGNPAVARNIVEFLDDAGLLRRPATAPEGETDWIARFEPDGKIYTYRRTFADMAQELTQRRDAGREPPHSVHVWIGDDWRQVTLS